jgi:hypothetical protein
MNATVGEHFELHPDDRADLRRSGLSDETIAAMGCWSAGRDLIRERTAASRMTDQSASLFFPSGVRSFKPSVFSGDITNSLWSMLLV